MKPLNVTLPNGSSMLVRYDGIVVFSPHFHLSHVLYSPSFQVNLISVSKIRKSLYYQIKFLADKCMIHDVKTHKMIGLGSLYDGLYRLQSSPSDSPLQAHCVSSVVNPCNKVPLHSCNLVSHHSVSNIPSSAIWHFRLGHLSNQRLSMVHSMYYCISVDNKLLVIFVTMLSKENCLIL